MDLLPDLTKLVLPYKIQPPEKPSDSVSWAFFDNSDDSILYESD